MTKPKPCPPAPGPLEGYAAHFDDLFSHLAQRRGFREYLTGLLAPRDRNKTLTCLAGAEPVAGAGHPAVQRLQFFLTESCWDPDRINARRLRLLTSDPASAPHEDGAMVIDGGLSDSGLLHSATSRDLRGSESQMQSDQALDLRRSRFRQTTVRAPHRMGGRRATPARRGAANCHCPPGCVAESPGYNPVRGPRRGAADATAAPCQPGARRRALIDRPFCEGLLLPRS